MTRAHPFAGSSTASARERYAPDTPRPKGHRPSWANLRNRPQTGRSLHMVEGHSLTPSGAQRHARRDMEWDRFAELRLQYEGEPLRETDLNENPIVQLETWLADAADLALANAMTLATVDANGQPHARVVLLKAFDAQGLVFFTDYTSDKGAQLAQQPRASALFFWGPLSRQVRVLGDIEPVSADISDAYFATRPRASNLSAMASEQSRPIASRAALEARVEALTQASAGKALERPSNWGGYRLQPTAFEFWQGQANRLHDRLLYTFEQNRWVRTRLMP